MTDENVITEEGKQMVGQETVKSLVREIEKGAIIKYAQAIDDPNPLWQDGEYAAKSAYGGIVAPPLFLSALWTEAMYTSIQAKLVEIAPSLKRLVEAGDEIEYFHPIRPGDALTIDSRFAEIKERQGKSGAMINLTMETTYTNQKGELVIRERRSIMKF
ncbi:MAG: MaoC family dehydratase N-terminal domain-containing protein [Chloroflexota bacterium]|nr:MaoC family dehydratase N-terminal domain-containing protein [Chloroflexota bacterium]